RIEQYLILHGGAAQARIVGYAGNCAITAFQHSVLNNLHLLRGTVRTHHDIAVNSSARAKERTETGCASSAQSHVRQSFESLSPSEIRIDLVFEIHFERRETV